MSRLGIKPLNLTLSRGDLVFFLILYSMFVVAIVSRVLPVFNSFVPPLHDPEAHAWYTKLLLDNKDITYFYSPGLHIISAFITEIFNISIAKSVNLTTQFINAFGVLTWGTAFYLAFRDKYIAFSASLIYILSPLPALFYATAGKNALVVGLVFMPFVFCFASLIYKKTTWLTVIAASIFLTVIGLIHYPTFAYVYLFIAVWVFYLLIIKFGKRRLLRGDLIKLATILILPAILITGWTASTKIFESSTAKLNNNEAKALQNLNESQFENINQKSSAEIKSYLDQQNQSVNIEKNPCTGKPLVSLKCNLTSINSQYKANPSYFSPKLVFLITLLSLLAILIFIRQTSSQIALLWLSTNVLLLLFLSIVSFKFLNIVKLTGIIIVYQTITPMVAVALGKILSLTGKVNFYFTLIILLILTIPVYVTAIDTGKRLNNRRVSWQAIVDNTDIKAYDWINTNIPDSNGFLNVVGYRPQSSSYIVP